MDLVNVKWEESLFPLHILFSPLLRLRYRVCLECAINKINLLFNRMVLHKAIELQDRKQASDIEFDNIKPSVGHIYIADRHDKLLESVTIYFLNKFNKIEAAKMLLPEMLEENFKELVYKELLNCVKLN
jgi:hypothetical protein